MLLAFTVVLSLPGRTFLILWLLLTGAALALWLWGSRPPQTLGQRAREAAWWACAPTAILCLPLVGVMGSYVDAYMALCRQLEPVMLVPLDLSILGTLYLTCFLVVLGWRSRPTPAPADAPVMLQT